MLRSNNSKSPLVLKYGFTTEEAKAVEGFLGFSYHHIQELAKMNLHVKGNGFLRSEILQVVESLGLNSTDLANWQEIGKIKSVLGGDIDLAIHVYNAGITHETVLSMPKEALGMDRLITMAKLRNI